MAMSESLASPSARVIDPADFLRPIEFLHADHSRQRSFCQQLGILVDDMHQPGHQKIASFLLEFALVELWWNMEDEEELLALLLHRRLPAGNATIAHVLRQYRFAATIAPQVVDGLNRLAAGAAPGRPLDFIISALRLMEILKQCVDVEESVVLPAATSKLTDREMRSLGSAMARRRGMSVPLLN